MFGTLYLYVLKGTGGSQQQYSPSDTRGTTRRLKEDANDEEWKLCDLILGLDYMSDSYQCRFGKMNKAWNSDVKSIMTPKNKKAIVRNNIFYRKLTR